MRTPGAARTLVLAQLTTTIGNGAFATTSALYFTRVIGFTPVAFGLGLSLAGVAGVLAGVPVGFLADRRGARDVAVALIALSGVAVAVYIVLHSYLAFVLAACCFALFDRGGYAARQALMASVLTGQDLVQARAKLRVVTNVGMSIGAGLGTIALAAGSPLAYRILLGADAVSFVGCALLLRRLPATERAAAQPAAAGPPAPEPAAEAAAEPSAGASAESPVAGLQRRWPWRRRPGGTAKPRLTVLRDRPYALISLVSMVLSLHAPLLDVIMPLWIVRHTGAPKVLISALYVLNTLTVVLTQVRISRRITTLDAAVRASRAAAVALVAVCVLFALSSGRSALPAILLLVAAAALHVYAEMTQSSAGWVLAFDLAPADRQGQYQGLFNSGLAANQMIAPGLLTALLIGWGVPGWLVLGAAFAAAGYATGPVTRWASRTRKLFAPPDQYSVTSTA
jgi:MFS family permease